jgi:hypothetical protein
MADRKHTNNQLDITRTDSHAIDLGNACRTLFTPQVSMTSRYDMRRVSGASLVFMVSSQSNLAECFRCQTNEIKGNTSALSPTEDLRTAIFIWPQVQTHVNMLLSTIIFRLNSS